jgi:flavin reductase (DIM6/NTAB) family NADH-FMN oxidoreductase RutF
VEHILNLGTHQLIIGQVIETHVTESCLTDGKPDLNKIQPFVYGMGSTTEYYTLGKSLGKCFSVGREIGTRK